jgi:hypothetical protein
VGYGIESQEQDFPDYSSCFGVSGDRRFAGYICVVLLLVQESVSEVSSATDVVDLAHHDLSDSTSVCGVTCRAGSVGADIDLVPGKIANVG